MLRLALASFSTYNKFTKTLLLIEKTSGLNEKKSILHQHYTSLSAKNQTTVDNIFKFIHEKPKTGIAEKLLVNFFREQLKSTSKSSKIEDVLKDYHQSYGFTKDHSIQLKEIENCLNYLIETTGIDSTKHKVSSISKLLSKMTYEEGLIFMKIITKDLRVGLKNKSIKLNQKEQKSFDLMLAKPLRQLVDVEQFCSKKQSNILADLKYDGERTLIIYKRGENIELLSRKHKSQINFYKNLALQIESQLSKDKNIKSIKIDGQIVCTDEQGQILPMQFLISQRGKDQKSENIKQIIYAFDVIEFNGKQLFEQKLKDRRNFIPQNSVIKKSQAKEIVYPEQKQQLVDYFLQMVEKKREGLILKGVDDMYYTNGTRKHWGKMKKGCRIHQSDTGSIDLDLILMGADYGKGKRKSTFATFLLGIYHEGKIYPVSRVGSGFKENQLQQLTKELEPLTKNEPCHLYQIPKMIKVAKYVEPSIVFQVSCQNLTRSPLYNFGFRQNYGGISLRFPVFERRRDDKEKQDCSSDVLIELAKQI